MGNYFILTMQMNIPYLIQFSLKSKTPLFPFYLFWKQGEIKSSAHVVSHIKVSLYVIHVILCQCHRPS